MEKKTECEIVEDLLFGYVDGVLNTESKKLVDKHLIECENCQKRLNEIKSDIKENENSQKKQVDYLKKVRRKNRLKSIFMALGIIIFIVFVMYIRTFIIFNNVLHMAKQSLSSNNMYIEMAGNFLNNNSTSERYIRKRYYKDGKYKEVDGILSDSGIDVLETTYTSVDSDERITFIENSKTVRIEKGENTKITNGETSLKLVPTFVRDDRIIIRILQPILMSVESRKNMPLGSYDNLNKSCYKFNSNIDKGEQGYKEIWIDTETGLPLKIVEKETMGFLYTGTNIVKEVRDAISEYKYEFNTVSEEDVKIPSFEGYEIKNIEY